MPNQTYGYLATHETWRLMVPGHSGVATGGQGGGAIAPPPGSGKWEIRKFAIWGKMTPNYSAVLDFDYQLRRHGLLPSNNYSQSPTKELSKSGSTWGVRSIKIFSQVLTALFHSNFKNFVCLQPESYEKVGSSDMLKELIELYKDDIDSSDDEYNLLCNVFRMWKREDTQNLPRTTGKVLKYLNDKNLVHVFPNIVTLIRIYLTIPASSASAERSFSRLKLIQSYLRSSMATERLQGLALLIWVVRETIPLIS